MANGHWTPLRPLRGIRFFYHQCGDWIEGEAFETQTATYCCEACADEAEAHNDGLGMCSGLVCDYPD
jgi:hypothetical protein